MKQWMEYFQSLNKLSDPDRLTQLIFAKEPLATDPAKIESLSDGFIKELIPYNIYWTI